MDYVKNQKEALAVVKRMAADGQITSSAGTLYALMTKGNYGKIKDNGYIESPMWVVNLRTGALQEIKPNTSSYLKDIYPSDYQGQMVAYLIITPKLNFSVDDEDDVFKDTFRSVTELTMRRGLCRTLKGDYMLFLNLYSAAKKAHEILSRKYDKIGKQMELMKHINPLI